MAKLTYISKYSAEQIEELLDKGIKIFGLNQTTEEIVEEKSTETETE